MDGKVQTNNGQLEKKKTRPPEVLPATLEFKEAGKYKHTRYLIMIIVITSF